MSPKHITLALTALFLAAPAFGAKNTKIVAKVNKATITLDQFNAEYEKVVSETLNPPDKQTFLEDLVRFEVGAQEAERQKVAQDPMVKKEIRKLLYKWLLEKKLSEKTKNITVKESDMKRYYRSNPEIRTSHILIQVRPGATDKERAVARSRAKKIYKEVQSSKRKFSELVSLYTDDIPTKASGGDLGWQTRVTMVPDYYNAAVKTSTNKVAPLVETKYGFHIIKVTGKRPYSKANKRKIRFGVFEQKRKAIFDSYFKSLKKKYKISTNKSLLK